MQDLCARQRGRGTASNRSMGEATSVRNGLRFRRGTMESGKSLAPEHKEGTRK